MRLADLLWPPTGVVTSRRSVRRLGGSAVPSERFACFSRGPRGGLALALGGGLHLVIGLGQRTVGVKRGVGAFPETGWHVLAAGFDIGDGAAAEIGECGEPGLAVTGGATVGGKLRA